MNIYIIKNNEAQGPLSLDQTVESIKNGEHSLSSLAWREGMADWQPVHALADVVGAVLPPIPATPQEQKVQTTPPPIPTQLEHNEKPLTASPSRSRMKNWSNKSTRPITKLWSFSSPVFLTPLIGHKSTFPPSFI